MPDFALSGPYNATMGLPPGGNGKDKSLQLCLVSDKAVID